MTIKIEDLTPEQLAEIATAHLALQKKAAEAANTALAYRRESVTARLAEYVDDTINFVATEFPCLVESDKDSKFIVELVLGGGTATGKGRVKVGGIGTPVAVHGALVDADGKYRRAVSLGSASLVNAYDRALKGAQGRKRTS